MMNDAMASKRMVVKFDISDTINFNCLDIIPLKLLRSLDQSVVNVNIERLIPSASLSQSQSHDQHHSAEEDADDNQNDRNSTISSQSVQNHEEVEEEEEEYEQPITIPKSNLTTTTNTQPEWTNSNNNDNHQKDLDDLDEFRFGELLDVGDEINDTTDHDGHGAEYMANNNSNFVNDLTPPSTSTWNISPLYEPNEVAATSYEPSEYLTIAEYHDDDDAYDQEDDEDTPQKSQIRMMTNGLVDSDCSITPVVFSLASLADVYSGDDIVTRCSSNSTTSEFEFGNQSQSDWRTAIIITTEPEMPEAAGNEGEEVCLENLTEMSDDRLLEILGEYTKIEEQKKRLEIVDKLMENIAATPVPSAEILEILANLVLSNNQNNNSSPPPPDMSNNECPSLANYNNQSNKDKSVEILSKKSIMKCSSKSKNNESKTKLSEQHHRRTPSTMAVEKKGSTIMMTASVHVKQLKTKKPKDKSKKKTSRKKRRKEDDQDFSRLGDDYGDDQANDDSMENKSKGSKSKKQKAITLFSHHLKKKRDKENSSESSAIQKLKNSLPRTADGRFAFSTKEAEEAIAQYVKAELAATLELGEAKLKPGKLRDVLYSVVSTEEQQQEKQDLLEKCVSSNISHNGQTTITEKFLASATTTTTTSNRTIAGGDGVGTTSHQLLAKKKPSPSSAINNNKRPTQQDNHNLLTMKGRPCCGIIPRQNNRLNFIKYQQQSIAAMLNISRSRMNGGRTMPATGHNFTRTTITRPPNSSLLELTRKRNAAALIGKQQLRSNRNAVTVVFGNE